MIKNLFENWDWKWSLSGTIATVSLGELQTYLGIAALMLSIVSALITIILSWTKFLDWWDKRSLKKMGIKNDVFKNDK